MVRSDPRPILHVGYHKTGSSWLQEELFPKARGVAVVPRTDLRQNLLMPSPLVFDPDLARANLMAGRRGRLVLSEEELSGNLHAGGLHGAFSRELVDRLHRSFPDGHVVIFVREQKAMVASAYKQYIKGGGTRGIRGFLTPSPKPHKTPNFSLDFLAYDRLVELYEDRFGADRVSVFLYEDLATRPAELVRMLCRTLGLSIDLDSISFAPVNAGYRSRTLALLRVLNHFHAREMPNATCVVNVPGLHGVLSFLAPRIDRLPGMGHLQQISDLLRPDEIRALEDRFRDSNARLEKGRALPLARHGYALP